MKMKHVIHIYGASGSLVDWGDELIPLFTLAIRLLTDTGIRIERLKVGEKQKFGDRIMPGGDMYTYHTEFIEWARKYDTGSVDMRSKAKHGEWQEFYYANRLFWMAQMIWRKIQRKCKRK